MSKNNTTNKAVENIFEQMAEVEQVASIVTENWDLRTRVSIEATKREAKEKLSSLKEQFFSLLMSNASVVVVTENVSKEDAEKYAKSQNAISVDASALYRVLSDSVERVMGKNREYGALQLTHLSMAVTEALDAVEASPFMRLPNPKEAVYLNTPEDVFVFVRDIVRSARGDELNKMHLEKAIKLKAINSRYTTAKPVVVVFGAGQEEANILCQLFGAKAKVVNQVSPAKLDTKNAAEEVAVEKTATEENKTTNQ